MVSLDDESVVCAPGCILAAPGPTPAPALFVTVVEIVVVWVVVLVTVAIVAKPSSICELSDVEKVT